MNLACKGVIDLFYLIWFVLQFQLKIEGWSHPSSVGEMTSSHKRPTLSEQEVSSFEETKRVEMFSSGLGVWRGMRSLPRDSRGSYLPPGREHATAPQWGILISLSFDFSERYFAKPGVEVGHGAVSQQNRKIGTFLGGVQSSPWSVPCSWPLFSRCSGLWGKETVVSEHRGGKFSQSFFF